jgi:oligosaccharide repeat unit polymerase
LKRHPYIVATIIATLLAIVVWLLVPKEYTAITKVSDEYREVDIAIGLDRIKAQIKNASGGANKGINDIGVYAKFLKSEDFAYTISQVRMPGKNMTYGEYLNKKDTIDAILDNINYNISYKDQTLTISFSDRDPVVAAQMLDSVTANLQAAITDHRHWVAEAALNNATAELERAKKDYQESCHRYSAFADSHRDLLTQSEIQEEKALKKDRTLSYNHLKNIANEYAREKALMQRAYMSFAVMRSNSTPLKPNSSFFGYLLSFISIALLFSHGLICYKRKTKSFEPIVLNDYFSPWSLTILIWVLILGLYYFLDTQLYPITEQFYYCLIIWIPIFCVCSYLSYELTESFKYNNNIEFNKNVFSFFLIISMIITPLYVYRIYQIVSMFSVDDYMENVRMLAVFGEGQGILGQSVILNQALLITALWAYPRIPLWQVIIPVIACFLNAIAIMEKGTLFFIFICIIFVLHHKKTIKLRTIIIAGLLLIGFFYIFNLQRAGADSDYSKNESVIDFIAMYVLSPPVAFCQLMPEITPQFGTNTFGTIYHFMIRFGVDDVVEKLKTQEFVMVPIPTNVYSIFQPFYIDFGYKGIAFFSALYGIICGFLYRLYKNHNTFGCCLYTFMIYVLVLQFYQENIFLSLATVIEFVFFVYLITQQHIKIRF